MVNVLDIVPANFQLYSVIIVSMLAKDSCAYIQTLSLAVL